MISLDVCSAGAASPYPAGAICKSSRLHATGALSAIVSFGVTARSCPFTGLGAEVARIQGGYANGLQVSTVCVYEGETDGSYMMSYLLFPSGAIIKRKLKKIEPFKPIKFARWAQEQFIETNRALQV